jgi:hypothetical protein
LDKKSSLRREAILWFIAPALSLAAALVTYGGEGQIKWPLLAATVFMAAMGFNSLRRRPFRVAFRVPGVFQGRGPVAVRQL